MNSCRLDDDDDPRKNPGRQTWVGVGFDDLFDKEKVQPDHVFTRDRLDEAVEELRGAWNAGLSTDCDVVLGVSVTRVLGEPITVNDALSLPRQLERFVIRIRGRGEGRAPALSNYVDVKSRLPQVLLPLRGEGAPQDFDRLKELLFASSAFPLAFAPQQLGYCMTHPECPHTWECEEPTRHDRFIDGGVFDNNPLRLAVEIAEYGLQFDASGRVEWTDLGSGGRDGSFETLTYQYLDPDTASYSHSSEEQAKRVLRYLDALRASPKRTPSTWRSVRDLVGALFVTARANQLYTLAEEHPKLIQERVRVAHRNFPTMSGLLGAFLGFFEEEFREFDFYLGMYDAYAEIVHQLDPSGEKWTAEALLSELDPSFGNPREEIPGPWKPLACMIGMYEPSARAYLTTACKNLDPEFRILLQVSLDRLYATCGALEASAPDPKYPNYHCEQARAGASPPNVEGVHFSKKNDSNRPADEEPEFDYVMRLLAQYRFEFEDLGLAKKQAKFATVQIQRKLLDVASALAKAQPKRHERFVMMSGARFGVNNIAYEPPKHWGYFTLGTGIEFGGSVLPFQWRRRSYLRLNLALQIGSLRTLVNPSFAAVTFSFVGGPELEMLCCSSRYIQPILGVRAGYQFGTSDRFTARSCTPDNARNDPRNCSQPVLQGYVALALVERIRSQLTFIWFPQAQTFGRQRFDLLMGFGMHFY